MARKKAPVDTHEGPVLAPSFRPFSVDDIGSMESAVAITICSADELSNLFERINVACRNWAFLRRLEVEPTLRQRQDWYQHLADKASSLSKVLGEPFEEVDQAPVSEPEQPSPTAMIYDEGYVQRARSNPDPLDAHPEDPTADADGSLPWQLARLRDAFDARYFGRPTKPRHFLYGNEALLEIGPLLDALAFAARTEAERLKQEATSPESNPEGEPSANEALVRELVPIYEGLFGGPISRAMIPVFNDAGVLTEQVRTTGAAVRFYRLVFDRLQTDDAPADNTIGAWIVRWQQNRRRTSD